MKLRRSAVAAFTLALLIVGAAIVTNVVPYNQILDQQRQVEAAAADLAALREENQELRARRDSLETPVEIERLAREKLGYVRPGEIAYVVLEPPTLPVATTSRDHTTRRVMAAPADDDSLLESVWEFVTGADLSE